MIVHFNTKITSINIFDNVINCTVHIYSLVSMVRVMEKPNFNFILMTKRNIMSTLAQQFRNFIGRNVKFLRTQNYYNS